MCMQSSIIRNVEFLFYFVLFFCSSILFLLFLFANIGTLNLVFVFLVFGLTYTLHIYIYIYAHRMLRMIRKGNVKRGDHLIFLNNHYC